MVLPTGKSSTIDLKEDVPKEAESGYDLVIQSISKWALLTLGLVRQLNRCQCRLHVVHLIGAVPEGVIRI